MRNLLFGRAPSRFGARLGAWVPGPVLGLVAAVLAWPSLLTAAPTLPSAAVAQPGPAAQARPALIARLQHERYTLPNGLEVILLPDRKIPRVAVNLWYHVGSGDEVVGKSGFAHLFEHMLFQGSVHVGRDQHFARLKEIGATEINGTTNADRTNYFEVVPSHFLETALWIESDRMGYLLPNIDQQSLNNQIDVVRNERRQRYDNVPYGEARFATARTLYPDGHPYRFLTIGRHEDLENASLADVVDFFKTWYVPANATLTLAGDFEVATAKQLVAKWFGTMPTSVRPPHVVPALPAVKPALVRVKDALAKLRMVNFVWLSPAAYAAGDRELQAAATLLEDNGAARLYKRLVLDEKLAKSVRVSQAGKGFSGEFTVAVVMYPGTDEARVRTIVEGEIQRLRDAGPEIAELDRYKTEIRAELMWAMESLMYRANLLQEYNHYVGNAAYFGHDYDAIQGLTPKAIAKAVAQYLASPPTTIVTEVAAPAVDGTSTQKGQ